MLCQHCFSLHGSSLCLQTFIHLLNLLIRSIFKQHEVNAVVSRLRIRYLIKSGKAHQIGNTLIEISILQDTVLQYLFHNGLLLLLVTKIY